jgi:dTDP-6-deoxy-L-talose 4-dehydrogenase (NAD+)
LPDGIVAGHITEDLFSENPEFWAEACDGIDTLIHAAWYAEPGKYVTSPRNLTCMSGTVRMAEAAASAGVKRFVGVGSCFEYDLDAGYLKTSTLLAPSSPYGAAKAATYLVLSRAMPHLRVSFAWCRLFYLYGEGEDPRRLVPYLRQCLAAGEPAELTSGQQIRDYLDVTEAGRRVAAIALSSGEGVFNICSGIPVTIEQMARRIAEEYGRTDLLRFGARPDNPEDPPCILGEPTPITDSNDDGTA